MVGDDVGGNAFPVSRAHFAQEGKMLSVDWCDGMSLRDYFAGQALMGRMVNGVVMQHTAKECYQAADLMLEARERKDG